MIGTIIGAVGALGSAIYGGIKSSIASKKAARLIQEKRDENKAWYNAEMSKDFTQRADVQSAIKKQRELLNEQYQNARATNKVAGGTDESLARQKQAANKSVSNTMTDVAAMSAQHKDAVEQQYRAQDMAIVQQQAQNEQQHAAQTAAAASQAVNAAVSLAGQGIAQGVAGAAGAPGVAGAKDAMAKSTAAGTLANAQAGLDKTLQSGISVGAIPMPKKSIV